MDALQRAVQLSSVLVLFAMLVFTLLDLCRYKYCQRQIGSTDWSVCCCVCSCLLLKMHARPRGYLFDRKLMRLVFILVFQMKYGFRFLFGDVEEKKEVMCYVLQLLVYCNYRMPASFSNEMIQCRKCGKCMGIAAKSF